MADARYEQLTQLGTDSPIPASPSEAVLETVANPHAGAAYLVRFTCPEFTTLCPVTGQPDFATITVAYTPDEKCVEMKSLKLYYLAFRDKGIFYEAVANTILDDLVAALDPKRMTVIADFNARGGTVGIVTVTHEEEKRE